MERCDVLIVGGGPAGSSCAGRLSAAGLDVLVLDKRAFPRDKTCAGWITPPILDTLHLDVDDYRQSRVFQPITGFRTSLMGGREVEIRYDRPMSYGIRRCEFDDYLLRRCGARMRLGQPLDSLERANGLWRVNGQIETPLVVGAGGHFCPVSRQLGGRADPRASVVAAQEVEFEVPAEQLARVHVAGDTPELFFCEDLRGYGWCFRKGRFLNIGLGRLDRERISEHVAAFCKYLRDCGKIECDLPARFHGHAYQLYERTLPKLIDEGVLLVGDAAGLAYPQSGEGIRPAVESGVMAAECILQAGGQYSRENLQPYCRQIEERFGRPRRRSVTDWLPAGWLRFMAARLLATEWFSRKVVLESWFLHTRERPLIGPG